VIFADVSGHGVPAALYSAMVKAAILSLGDEHPVPPATAMARMNRF
jgi:serine phosphatase RsbU (regulator of sigma subunit)